MIQPDIPNGTKLHDSVLPAYQFFFDINYAIALRGDPADPGRICFELLTLENNEWHPLWQPCISAWYLATLAGLTSYVCNWLALNARFDSPNTCWRFVK